MAFLHCVETYSMVAITHTQASEWHIPNARHFFTVRMGLQPLHQLRRKLKWVDFRVQNQTGYATARSHSWRGPRHSSTPLFLLHLKSVSSVTARNQERTWVGPHSTAGVLGGWRSLGSRLGHASHCAYQSSNWNLKSNIFSSCIMDNLQIVHYALFTIVGMYFWPSVWFLRRECI